MTFLKSTLRNTHRINVIFLTLCCICLFHIAAIGQPVCDPGSQHSCSTSVTLDISDGTNISDQLLDAISNYCEIRIPNNGNNTATYLVNPLVFSGDDINQNTSLQNKTIILESGVTIQSIVGGYSYCSQSMFTFDGNGNKNISIRGEHEDCEFRPILRMPEPIYVPDSLTGFLVASDDVGEPYLNDQGEPNFVFDDGDSDPYFDDNGNPNLITPQNNHPKVEADCDYNDLKCNRRIIVWCPLNWEGRHIIAIHGASGISVSGLDIQYAAGGDGILLTDSETGDPAHDILIEDVHFHGNARSGINVNSSTCSLIKDCFVSNTGYPQGVENFITIKGGIVFDGEQSQSDIYHHMKNHEIDGVSMQNNKVAALKFRFPSPLNNLYGSHVDLAISNICIDGSPSAILFDESLPVQNGSIKLTNTYVGLSLIGLEVTDNWINESIDVNLENIDLSSNETLQDVFISSLSPICNTMNADDICLGASDDLCSLGVTCDNSDNDVCLSNSIATCVPDLTPPCDPCFNHSNLAICSGDSVQLEIVIDIPDILADRPLPINGWRNQLETDHCCLDGDVELCFTLSENENRTVQVLGLNSDPNTNTHFNTIDHGIYLLKLVNHPDGYKIRVYENGAIKYDQNHLDLPLGTTYCVKRINGDVTYIIDGEIIYESTVNSEGSLCFDNSFYSSTHVNWVDGLSKFTDIQFKKLNYDDVYWMPNDLSATNSILVEEDVRYVANFINDDLCENIFIYDITALNAPNFSPIILDPTGTDTLVHGNQIELCDGECVKLSVYDPNVNLDDFIFEWSANTPVDAANPGQSHTTNLICESGTYILTITSDEGCTQEIIFEVIVHPLPIVDMDENGPITCYQPEVTVSTTPGYCYQWSNGMSGSNQIVVSTPGLYCVTVTDCITGCTQTACIPVEENTTLPLIDLNQNGPLTCDQTTVTVSTIAGYCYEWSDGSTDSESIEVSSPGDYCVTVTDCVNGCSVTGCIEVKEDITPPNLSCVIEDDNNNILSNNCTIEICEGECVILTIDDNNIDPNDYDFEWSGNTPVGSNGSSDLWYTDLICSEDTYTLTITGSNGCQQVLEFEVIVNPIPSNTITGGKTLTCDVTESVITVTDGNCYLWNTGETSNSITVTTPGEYCVTITDCNTGCQNFVCTTIEQDTIYPIVEISQTGPIICGNLTADISLTPGYCYEWDTGETENTITVSEGGIYCATITDCDNGCSITECITVLEDLVYPDFDCLIIDGSGNELATCDYSTCDGQGVTLTIDDSFGIPQNYTYEWSANTPSSNTAWESGLVTSSGNYIVTITDPSNNCFQILEFSVSIAYPPVFTIIQQGQLDCEHDHVDLIASQNSNFAYQWSDNLGTGSTVEVSVAGTYCVTVTDTNTGCMASQCFTVEAADQICDVGSFNQNSVINGVDGGGPYPFDDGLAEGAYLCWTFNAQKIPDQLIINIGGNDVLDTGATTGVSSCGCPIVGSIWGIDDCSCVSTFVGDFEEGDCITFPTGQGVVTSLNVQETDCDGGGVSEVSYVLSGSILITDELACQPITVTISGNVCESDGTTVWNASLTCCDDPVICDDGGQSPDTNPFNAHCRSNDNTTILEWDEDPSAESYEISINAGPSECCPDNDPAVPETFVIPDSSFFVLPSSMPECYTWTVYSVDDNGQSHALSEAICMSDTSTCIPIITEDPCPEIFPPTDISCSVGEMAGISLSWSAVPNAIGYNVIITFDNAGECQNEGGNEGQMGRMVYQVFDNNFILPNDLGECYTITIESICYDYSVSAPSDPLVVDSSNPCTGINPQLRQSNHSKDDNDFRVYPNPFNHIISIEHGNINEKFHVSIFDVHSQLIFKSTNEHEGLFQYDTSEMISGLYFVQITTSDKSETIQIIKR